MKKYKAIFFDWDGTAVKHRSAPVDQVLPIMQQLLEQGIILVVISGTTYENISQGNMHQRLSIGSLPNLFMGLGRGAFDYGFHDGNVNTLYEIIPDQPTRLKIHQVAFEIHNYLLEKYTYETDIVFTRPNYCKIDLLVNLDRGGHLYFQPGELDLVNHNLGAHQYQGGICALLEDALDIGRKAGLELKATTDAKFLEIGMSTKADNVDWLLWNVIFKRGIPIEECCFWGDEFTFLGKGVPGSDAMMITDSSRKADFFDVSEAPLELPPEVQHMGGSVPRFLEFLNSQCHL